MGVHDKPSLHPLFHVYESIFFICLYVQLRAHTHHVWLTHHLGRTYSDVFIQTYKKWWKKGSFLKFIFIIYFLYIFLWIYGSRCRVHMKSFCCPDANGVLVPPMWSQDSKRLEFCWLVARSPSLWGSRKLIGSSRVLWTSWGVWFDKVGLSHSQHGKQVPVSSFRFK